MTRGHQPPCLPARPFGVLFASLSLLSVAAAVTTPAAGWCKSTHRPRVAAQSGYDGYCKACFRDPTPASFYLLLEDGLAFVVLDLNFLVVHASEAADGDSGFAAVVLLEAGGAALVKVVTHMSSVSVARIHAGYAGMPGLPGKMMISRPALFSLVQE